MLSARNILLSARNILNDGLDVAEIRRLKPDDFHRENARTQAREGDVLLTIVGSIGRAHTISAADGPLTFQRSVAVLHPRDISSKYCCYQFQSPHFQRQLEQAARGTAQKGVYLKSLAGLSLNVAPREEQDRIVAEIEKQFTRLDAATAALKRVQANLKRYRASVLKAACEGRLIPTEAELARKEGREYEPADQLLQRILRERRARWEADTLAKMIASGRPPKDDRWKEKYKEPARPDTANLPSLPDGWCWAGLEQIAFFQNGRPFPSSQYSSDGIKLLRPGNLFADGSVRWNEKNTRSLPTMFAEQNPDLIVGGRELIMNLTAQSLRDDFLGRVCITGHGDHALLNQRLARITPIVVPPEFLLWALKSPWFRRFVDGLNTGSLIQHMFTSQLTEFAVPLPPLPEQVRISEATERILSVVDAHEITLESSHLHASNLRRAILSAAFGGQLVPQNPGDEPVAELLERVGTARAQERPISRSPRRQQEPSYA